MNKRKFPSNNTSNNWVPFAFLGTLFLIALTSKLQNYLPPQSSIPEIIGTPATARLQNNSPLKNSVPAIVATPAKPRYVRPTKADNGEPFPATSAYIDGYFVELNDGLSSIVVDNSQNNSDAFVKLFSTEATPARAVRNFFLRAGESFTMEKVRAGKYDLRYRDLDSGRISKTPEFEMQEIKTEVGTQYGKMTFTLYPVANGNLKTEEISESEF